MVLLQCFCHHTLRTHSRMQWPHSVTLDSAAYLHLQGLTTLTSIFECRSSEEFTARSAAAVIRNLSCEAACRKSIRDYQGTEKLLCLLGGPDLKVHRNHATEFWLRYYGLMPNHKQPHPAIMCRVAEQQWGCKSTELFTRNSDVSSNTKCTRLAQASICASEALLNVLTPSIARRGEGTPHLQEAVHRLLLCALVLSTTRHSLQHL